MESNLTARLLKILLNVIGVILFVLFLAQISRIINTKTYSGIRSNAKNIIYTIIFFVSYLVIILTLNKIIKSILEKNPFNKYNIIRFRIIGYSVFVIGIIDAICNYGKPDNTGIEIFATSYGSLKPIFFLYISIGCLTFILGDIFKMAMTIKNENDLTI